MYWHFWKTVYMVQFRIFWVQYHVVYEIVAEKT
jgi:hypothetical protein